MCPGTNQKVACAIESNAPTMAVAHLLLANNVPAIRPLPVTRVSPERDTSMTGALLEPPKIAGLLNSKGVYRLAPQSAVLPNARESTLVITTNRSDSAACVTATKPRWVPLVQFRACSLRWGHFRLPG